MKRIEWGTGIAVGMLGIGILVSGALEAQGQDSAIVSEEAVAEAVESVESAATEAAAEVEAVAEEVAESVQAEGAMEPLTADQAKDHIGTKQTVCGRIVDSYYNAGSTSQVTLLNLDRPHPNQPFTIVISKEHRESWGAAPETALMGKTVCVTGTIVEHKGKPQVEVQGAADLVVQPDPGGFTEWGGES